MITAVVMILACMASPKVHRLWAVELPTRALYMSSSSNAALIRTEKDIEFFRLSDGKLLRAVNDVGLSLSNGTLIEHRKEGGMQEVVIYSPPDYKEAHAFQVEDKSGLGEVLGDSYYTSGPAGTVRYRISDGQKIAERKGLRFTVTAASNGMIYGHTHDHEVFGVNASDFSKAWRCYCDTLTMTVLPDGVVATGGIAFTCSRIDLNGNIVWNASRYNGLLIEIVRAYPPAVVSDVVAVPGTLSSAADSIRTISPYLFGLDLNSGNIKWKVPMAAEYAVSVGGYIAVVDLKPTQRPNWFSAYAGTGNGIWTKTVELRDPRTGKLVSTIGVPSAENTAICGNGDSLLVAKGRTVSAYVVRTRRS